MLAAVPQEERPVRSLAHQMMLQFLLNYARRVVIVPGYRI
jgi:hypothetical protein